MSHFNPDSLIGSLEIGGSDYAGMAGTIVADLSVASTLPLTLFIGALVFILVVAYTKFGSSKDTDQGGLKSKQKSNKPGGKEKSQVSKNKKKLIDRRGRQNQSVFVHPWSLGSLKGHRTSVLDLDFSSNGKYMASCAEDPPRVMNGAKTLLVDGLVATDNSDEDSSSGSQGSRGQGGLSRRQRRNATKKKKLPTNQSISNKETKNGHLKLYQKLGLTDAQLFQVFSEYLISKKQLRECGFPVECVDRPGVAYIKSPDGFSSPTGFCLNGSNLILRKCCRCQLPFFVHPNGDYLSLEPCIHHWGKLKRTGKENGGQVAYTCCNGWKNSPGCTVGRLHVSLGLTSGYLNGFVNTTPCEVMPSDNNYGVFAIDCEMCFTTSGLELVKVSLVRPDGSVAYNSLVKPANAIIDYNTRFSGITEKQLSRVTKNLEDVQKELKKFIHAETILVGHSLENDLKALRLLHSTVVDTSVVFPHYYGLPYRRSLKSLVSSYLKKEIQTGVHNSVEDARSSLELMLWRLKKDLSQ